MVNTGDKLICTAGNTCFVEGQVYAVGNIINNNLFEINIGSDGEHWYASEDNDGIHVRFNAIKSKVCDAQFAKIEGLSYTPAEPA